MVDSLLDKDVGPGRDIVIKSLGIAIALTVVGDAVSETLALPVPGAAIGMLMLAATFAARGGIDIPSARLFDTVAPHLPLFFIPAAAGVVASSELLGQTFIYIVFAIILGTSVTIIVTGTLVQFLLVKFAKIRTA